MALEPDEVRELWPELEPLLAVESPSWRFSELCRGRFFGARLSDGWAEVCYIADKQHVSVNRGPVGPCPRQGTPPLDFTGPIIDAVAALIEPPPENRS